MSPSPLVIPYLLYILVQILIFSEVLPELSLLLALDISYIYVSCTLRTICCCCLVTKSYPVLCDPIDCSLPGSSVHGISQARILECVAIFFSRVSSQPRDQTHVSRMGKQVLYHWATTTGHKWSLIKVYWGNNWLYVPLSMILGAWITLNLY